MDLTNITKEELLEELKKLQDGDDKETDHIEADKLLLRYIYDKDITEEYTKIAKWYS
jgi:hypothetical protein